MQLHFNLIFPSPGSFLTQMHFLFWHCLTFLSRGSHDISIISPIILLSLPVYCGLYVKYEMSSVPYQLFQCGVRCIEWDLSLHCLLNVEWKQWFITGWTIANFYRMQIVWLLELHVKTNANWMQNICLFVVNILNNDKKYLNLFIFLLACAAMLAL